MAERFGEECISADIKCNGYFEFEFSAILVAHIHIHTIKVNLINHWHG